MTTENFIKLALIPIKFVKDQLIEINKNIEKLANTEKKLYSCSLINFALTEGILKNVILLNMNKSTVKDSSTSLYWLNWHQFREKYDLIISHST